MGEGGGDTTPSDFQINEKFVVILVPMVSLESPLNSDNQNKYQHPQRLASVTS